MTLPKINRENLYEDCCTGRNAVNLGDLSWDFFNKYGSADIYDKTPNEQCAEKCSSVSAEAVYTNRVLINKDFLNKCPTVKYVSALGTGYDMIDIEACKQRNVAVCNVPDYSTPSVAQHLKDLHSDLSDAVKDNPLLYADNCIITPHIAWASIASRKRLMEELDNSLGDFVKTGNGLHRIV